MKFNVTIDRDEDGVWVIECPSIPGCVSTVGCAERREAHRSRLMRFTLFTPSYVLVPQTPLRFIQAAG